LAEYLPQLREYLVLQHFVAVARWYADGQAAFSQYRMHVACVHIRT